MRVWNVRVHRDGHVVSLGEVSERNEELARCAALSRFGISEDELAAGDVRADWNVVLPDEDFDVSPAT